MAVLWSTDIIQDFILRGDLTFGENVVLNYLIQTREKAIAISKSMNFMSRSAAQRSLTSLKDKYNIISISKDWKVTINHEFRPYMHNFEISNTTGRPKKPSPFEAE